MIELAINKPRNAEERERLETRLLTLSDRYDRNFEALVKYGKTCRCNPERGVKCSSRRHRYAILRERVLNLEHRVLQKILGVGI